MTDLTINMSEPVRVIERNGKSYHDTWSDYSRRHRWLIVHRVPENPVHRDELTYVIRCTRCAQTRRVWAHADEAGFRYGCPRVPWGWRKNMKHWSVNEPPPWVK